MSVQNASRGKLIAAFAAVYIIWGSTYLAIRFAVETLPPFLMASIRFLIAGSLMYGYAWSRGMTAPTKRQWKSAVIIGGLLFLVGNGGVVFAEQRISSSMAALLITTEPLWIVLMQWGKGGSRPNMAIAIGLIIGVIGTVVLAGPSELAGTSNVDLFGVAVMTISTLGWASGSLYAATASMPRNPILATSMQMLSGGVLLLVAGTFSGEWSRLDVARISSASILSFVYLAVFGSIVAFTAYSYLLRTVSPSLVSTYAYVNPVIAVFLGWALGGESITMQTIFAAVLLISAVVIITTLGNGSDKVAEKTFTNES
jgi:drug/metabolite transporter (DMT)-like permease